MMGIEKADTNENDTMIGKYMSETSCIKIGNDGTVWFVWGQAPVTVATYIDKRSRIYE